MPVQTLFGYLEDGDTINFLEGFPTVFRDSCAQRGIAAFSGASLMRMLIDEWIDERLRLLFPDHDCQTVRFANLAEMENGCLLQGCGSGWLCAY